MAVGQAELMNIYNQRFSVYNQQTAQILVTRDVVDYPESRKNVRNTLEQLLIMDTIPIVNENDTVHEDLCCLLIIYTESLIIDIHQFGLTNSRRSLLFRDQSRTF